MFHLIGTRTMPTTLAALRRINEQLLPPPTIIVTSVSAQRCYDRCRKIVTSVRPETDMRPYINGLEVAKTADWTYWIVEDKQP